MYRLVLSDECVTEPIYSSVTIGQLVKISLGYRDSNTNRITLDSSLFVPVHITNCQLRKFRPVRMATYCSTSHSMWFQGTSSTLHVLMFMKHKGLCGVVAR